MKKGIFLLTLMFILGYSTVGLANKTFNADGTGTGQTDANATDVLKNFRCSNNVKIVVNSAAQSYAAVSGHLNGDREFGTASGDSKIYWKDKAKGTAVSDTDPSGNTAGSVNGTGWSSL